MKRMLILFLVLTVPAVVFLSVWQVFSFQQLETQVGSLEAQQKEWFEENKRKIIGIEYLSSPRRLDQIAREELDLKKMDPDKVIRIVVPKEKGRVDG
jgi:cell division protein FtsL